MPAGAAWIRPRTVDGIDSHAGGNARGNLVIELPSLSSLDRSASTRIWLCVSPADMRCGFDRLAELASSVTGQDPLSGHLFLFRSRHGDRLKILLWDKDGFVLWYKRLEEGVFKMPR